jgi:hypothetical protein
VFSLVRASKKYRKKEKGKKEQNKENVVSRQTKAVFSPHRHGSKFIYLFYDKGSLAYFDNEFFK